MNVIQETSINIPSMVFIYTIHNMLFTKHLDYMKQDLLSEFSIVKYFFQEIKQINGIPVNVILFCHFCDRINTTVTLDYKILSNVVGLNDQILYYSIHYRNSTSIEVFRQCLKDLYINLPKFKVSRNTGKIFISDPNSIDEELDGQYLLGEECSVCFTKTITQTPCTHHLCCHCWCKIGNLNYLLCPICRKQIFNKFDPFLSDELINDDFFSNELNISDETDAIELIETDETGQTDETETETELSDTSSDNTNDDNENNNNDVVNEVVIYSFF